MLPGQKCLLKELKFAPVPVTTKRLIPLQMAGPGQGHFAHPPPCWGAPVEISPCLCTPFSTWGLQNTPHANNHLHWLVYHQIVFYWKFIYSTIFI